MKEWKVYILPDAEDDIDKIYSYIAFVLLEPTTAQRLVSRIIKAIQSLEDMPERHRLYDKEPWRSKGVRLFSVGNYIVFYHTEPEKGFVFIDSVIYGARDINIIVEESIKK